MSRKPQALAIIETPLQLLCAMEAARHFGAETKYVVRRSGVGRNDQQCAAMAAEMGLDHLVVPFRRGNERADALRAIWACRSIALRHFDLVFLGSYFSGAIRLVGRMVRSPRRIWLDDGVATILVQQQVAGTPTLPELFTFMDVDVLPGQRVERHEFQGLAASMAAERRPSPAIFIGQPLVEKGWIDEDWYIGQVKAAAAAEGEGLVYHPHRGEPPRISQRLESIPGLTVQPLDSCIEYYLLRTGNVPCRMYSFFSTACFSLGKILPNAQIVAILPVEMDRVGPPHYAQIKALLSTRPGVRVVPCLD